jgi:hypothetical protein
MLELRLATSVLDAVITLVNASCARVKLEVAATIDILADIIAVLALDCTLVRATFALVATKFATVTLEKADEVAMLAFWLTTETVEEAESWADLMPLEADIDACWSC